MQACFPSLESVHNSESIRFTHVGMLTMIKCTSEFGGADKDMSAQ